MNQLIHPRIRPVDTELYEVVGDSEDRDAWLAARSETLGASEVATILGLNPYESPFALWHRKKGLLPPIQQSEPMRWGQLLEDGIAHGFAERTGTPVRKHGWLLRSRTSPWLSVTPDYEIVGQNALLEIKNVSSYKEEEWISEGPVTYQAQVQMQLAVTGADFGWLAGLVGGQKLYFHRIERSEGFLAAMAEETKDFYDRLKNDDPPPPDPSPSTSKALRMLPSTGEVLDLPEEVLQWHLTAERHAEQEKYEKEEKEKHRQMIEAYLGLAEVGVLPRSMGKFTFKMTHRKEFVVAASSSRVLRYSKKA